MRLAAGNWQTLIAKDKHYDFGKFINNLGGYNTL